MVVDIYSTAGVLKASGVTITAVSGTTTATVTLDAAVTAASGDIIVRANSFNQEIQGIEVFLDGGTSSIFGVNRATFPIFNGSLISASGQLRLDLMQQALNETRRRGGKQKASAIFCDFDSERYYNKLLVSDKRFIGEKIMGDGSFTQKDMSYLEFGGIPVVADKDSPTQFAFLHSDGWKKYVLSELEFAQETGSDMIAQVGSDAWEVRLRLFANMFHEKPASCAKLSGYTSP
jgi:hypothetical protein